MCLSMAPRLVNLSKELARDPAALNRLSMSRASATYKLTYGLGKSMKEEMVADIGDSFFSLNIDEATSTNHEKVLTVLIGFFSNAKQKVLVQHLGSVSLLRVTSANVVAALEKMLHENGLKWSRCLSILMDSCNVMRGVKSGVETTIRKEKAPHLLDINGDSCHHIHNSAKAFTTVFGGGLEKMFGDIFTDFENKQFQDCLSLICLSLEVKYTRPERFLKHRWLSALDSSADTLRLFDALTVLYYEFLPKQEKAAYHSTVIDILTSKKVNMASRDEIREVRKQLSTIGLTAEGKQRKERIVKRVFYHRDDTLLQLKFYVDVLTLLKEFVMLFQRQDPLIHVLHEEQLCLVWKFLLFFVKPECLKPLTVGTLLSLNLDDEDIHLSLEAIFLGKAELPLTKLPSSVQQNFRQTALRGYIACGKVLLQKMPLKNGFLQAAGGLDPKKKASAALESCLKLPALLPTDVMQTKCSDDETSDKETIQAAFNAEIRDFFGEDDIPALEEGQRVDEWWAKAINRYNLHLLGQVVRAVLSIFHGPVVESSFNIMGDVIDGRSGRMNMATFDAFHTTRYALAATGKSATAHFRRENVMRDPVNKALVNNIANSREKYHQVLAEKNEEKKRKLAVFDKQQSRVAKKAQLKHYKKQAKSTK